MKTGMPGTEIRTTPCPLTRYAEPRLAGSAVVRRGALHRALPQTGEILDREHGTSRDRNGDREAESENASARRPPAACGFGVRRPRLDPLPHGGEHPAGSVRGGGMAEQETFAFAAKKAEPGASAARGSGPKRAKTPPPEPQPDAKAAKPAEAERAEERRGATSRRSRAARAARAPPRTSSRSSSARSRSPSSSRRTATCSASTTRARRCSPTVKEARRQLARRLRGGAASCPTSRVEIAPARRDALPRSRSRTTARASCGAGAEDLRQAALRLEVPPPAAEPRPAGHRHLRGGHVRPAHHRQADRDHHAHRARSTAHHFELVIDTKKNEPKVKRDEEVEVGRASTARASRSSSRATTRRASARSTSTSRRSSLANPHVEIAYVPPKAEEHGASYEFPRVADELPPRDRRDQAAPARRRARRADADAARHRRRATCARASQSDFSRVSSTHRRARSARRAGVARRAGPREIAREEAERSTRRSRPRRSWRRRRTASRRSARS